MKFATKPQAKLQSRTLTNNRPEWRDGKRVREWAELLDNFDRLEYAR